MKKSKVIEYFGTVKATAQALGITSEAVSQWPEQIPKLRAYEIQKISGGALCVGEAA